MAQARIFWTFKEKELLIKQSARLMFNAQADSPVMALRASMAALPKDRQRDPLRVVESKMPWFRSWFDEELRKLQLEAQLNSKQDNEAREKQQAADAKRAAEAAAAAARLAEQAPPTPQPTAPEKPHPNGHAMNGHAMNGAAVERDAVNDPPPTKIEHRFQSLRAMFVDELASVFVEAALKAMGSTQFGEQFVRIAAADEAESTTAPQPPQRIVFQRTTTVRKPAILIVGLRGGQKTEIQRDYGAHFDLRFVGSDESKDQLRSMTEKADTTIVMTDFISHSHEDIVKARSSSYIPRSGGMTQLRSTLAGLAQ
jgi:multidrug efflux pump subunit AcrA (membrane-fusion protein)